jgi:hypothetical protein
VPEEEVQRSVSSKQLHDFLVAGLAEVGTVKADGVERLWRCQKNHFVAFGVKVADNGPRRYRRKHEAAWLNSPDSS